MDAVTDLRDSLRALGSDLIVRIGKPEEACFHMSQSEQHTHSIILTLIYYLHKP